MIKQWLVMVDGKPLSKNNSFLFMRHLAVHEFNRWKKKGKHKVKLKYQKTLF